MRTGRERFSPRCPKSAAIGGSAATEAPQALTQSVFAAVHAFGRMDVLGDIRADLRPPGLLRRPAPGTGIARSRAPVQSLREPEPTSVDVLLERPSHRVAVECKLMEREFGVCSRPQLEPDDWSYEEQYCDGDYRVQRGRTARCALAEIGVRYWTYLPQLFDWDPRPRSAALSIRLRLPARPATRSRQP